MQYRIRNGNSIIATVDAKSFHWAGLTPNVSLSISVCSFNGTREGTRAILAVKTRGIRVNVPTIINASSSYELIYEEYPLGSVPIGTEPKGMFGGGNKQTLPAKVVSTGSSSVLEITTSFNLMKDNLTMKKIDDGSFAVYDGYKALFLMKGMK